MRVEGGGFRKRAARGKIMAALARMLALALNELRANEGYHIERSNIGSLWLMEENIFWRQM